MGHKQQYKFDKKKHSLVQFVSFRSVGFGDYVISVVLHKLTDRQNDQRLYVFFLNFTVIHVFTQNTQYINKIQLRV